MRLKQILSLYDAAENIEYVNMVLCESLRLFPPGPKSRTNRECKLTCAIGMIDLSYSTMQWTSVSQSTLLHRDIQNIGRIQTKFGLTQVMSSLLLHLLTAPFLKMAN